jgi:hypothetical protein
MPPRRTRADRQRVRRGGVPADAGRPSGRQLAIAGVVAVLAVAAFIAISGGGAPSPSCTVPPGVRQTSHVRGLHTAPVTIEEWADFQCPACGRFARTTEPWMRGRCRCSVLVLALVTVELFRPDRT